MSILLRKDKGFTLIEIVLVLAIAGLLLVIVFLAVSGAQKSRRDSQRRNDLSRLASQVETYASNHLGIYPTAAEINDVTMFAAFIPANFKDPTTGDVYGPPFTAGNAPASKPYGNISYIVGDGKTCDGEDNLNGQVYTLRMKLEQGIACRDNK